MLPGPFSKGGASELLDHLTTRRPVDGLSRGALARLTALVRHEKESGARTTFMGALA